MFFQKIIPLLILFCFSQISVASVLNEVPPEDQVPSPFLQQQAPEGGSEHCLEQKLSFDENTAFCGDPKTYWGFSLTNRKSPRINPDGGQIFREYSFGSLAGSRQEIGLEITELGTNDPNYRDSWWTMLTDLVFLPRKNLPAISSNRLESGQEVWVVTLMTGETVVFDKATKEILSGVLQETRPIDENPDRMKRQFVGLNYTGRGVMIRSDRRGESPRDAFEFDHKTPHPVEVFWNGQICRKLHAADLWQQGPNPDDGGGNFRFASDQSALKLINSKCGWDISLESE